MHTRPMGDSPGEQADRRTPGRVRRRRRVLVEDARRAGNHLRATWHPDERQFVVSTWSNDVCTGTARLQADAAAALAALIVDGLADASAQPTAPRPTVPDTRSGLAGLVDRLRWLVRGTTPAGPSSARPAPVTPLRSHTA